MIVEAISPHPCGKFKEISSQNKYSFGYSKYFSSILTPYFSHSTSRIAPIILPLE
jgi:hypothetical protein